MDFQIDFGNALSPAPVDNAPLYASVAGVAHTLGPEECVFEDRASGEIHVMTVQVVQALELCRPFRSLDQHGRRCLRGTKVSGGTDPAFRKDPTQRCEPASVALNDYGVMR